MKKYKYEILALAVLLVGGYFISKELKKNKELANSNQNQSPEVNSQKESDIDTIINSGKYTSERSTLQTFSPSYLKDWARAILNKQEVFRTSGVQYWVQGGKRVVIKK